MAGLRERKKQATSRAILKSARELMVKDGFEATSMESVAERAEVSVGSLYNYFADKRALLLGVFADSTSEVLQQGNTILEDDYEDLRSAIEPLIHLYAKSFQQLEKSLLRQAIGMSFTMEVEISDDFAQFDFLMMQQLATLVLRLQEKEIITAGVTVEQATLSLYGTFIMSILIWLSTPGAKSKDLFKMIDRQLEVVFLGLEPRGPKQELPLTAKIFAKPSLRSQQESKLGNKPKNKPEKKRKTRPKTSSKRKVGKK